MVRALGIDPGTAIMGYGVVEQRGSSLQSIDYGVLLTEAGAPLPSRLLTLHGRLRTLLAEHRPDVMAVEELFFSRNTTTALAVGHARGVALLAAAEAEIPVAEYTPLQVKDAVVGYGRATKDQVQQMIRTLLRFEAIPKPDDAADALAVAICHLHSARFRALTER